MIYNPDKYISNLGSVLKWKYIDLDGTIAESVWPESKGIGKPIPAQILKCEELVRAGKKLFVWTSRPWTDFEAIDRWLEDHGIRHMFKGIICGKPLAEHYIDDRNKNASEASWL